MVDLSTTYMGLKLKNPLIVGSSGLTNTVAQIKEHAKNGAGAVVLKSLFEEQIRLEAEHLLMSPHADNLYSEAQDYITNYTKEHKLSEYLSFIEDSKKAVDIPIIASINCVTSEGWPEFAKKIETAGADALELNVFVLPSDFTRSSDENENVYFKVVAEVRKFIKIPFSLKISYYFTNLAQMIQRLSFTGIQGIVLFNRFFSPDFDLKEQKIIPAHILSDPSELSNSLRWISIMAGRVRCDLCSSTGVHDGLAVVKQIMAGANAVQVVSALYKHKNDYLSVIIKEFENWMNENGFKNLDSFRGNMSQANLREPAAIERVQFMKYFSGIE
jgi:dihydroorotate dehydrogenase (fumarate)